MAGGTMSGSGTVGDPYQVEDATDLKAIETYGYDKYYIQMNDITLGVFVAVGHTAGTGKTDFTGFYDGDGFSIKDGSVTVTSGDYYNGIFAYINGGEVSNVILDNIDGTYSLYGGTLAGGLSSATIDEITVKNLTVELIGSPSANADLGGLAGWSDDSNITNITIENVQVTAAKHYLGICLGEAIGTTQVIGVTTDSNCSVIGTSTASSIGGIIGRVNEVNVDVEKCLNEGTVSNATGNIIGGIVGNLSYGDVRNCHNKGSITGGLSVGGITGASGSNTSTIRYCLNEGNIVAVSNGGGISGIANSSVTIQYNYSLNATITRSSGVLTAFGRITGTSSGTISDNYALDTMTMNT